MVKKTCCLLSAALILSCTISYASIENVQWSMAENTISVSGTADSAFVLLSYSADAKDSINNNTLSDGDVSGSILHAAEINPVGGRYSYSFTVLPGDSVINAVVSQKNGSEPESVKNVYCSSENYVNGLLDDISSESANEIKDDIEDEVNFSILMLDSSFKSFITDFDAVYQQLAAAELKGTVQERLTLLQSEYLKSTFFAAACEADLEAVLDTAEKNGLFSTLGFDSKKTAYYTGLENAEKKEVVSLIKPCENLNLWQNGFYTRLALYNVSKLTYGYMNELLNEFDDVLMLDSWPLSSSVTAMDVYKGIAGKEFLTPDALDSAIQTLSSGFRKPAVSGGGGGAPSYQKPVTDNAAVAVPMHTENNDIKEAVFDDVSDYDWALEAVTVLYNKGIVSGKGGKSFMPEDGVSRAEILKMLVGAFMIDEKRAVDFSDVAKSHWVYPYLEKSGKLALGDGEGRFYPDDRVRREDIAVLIRRAMGRDNEVTENYTPFADDKKISDYAKDAVYLLKELEIVNGNENRFMPESYATRAEAAVMIYRAMAAKER